MDDLIGEFVTETAESLDVVDVELVKFEQEPNNAEILGNIFRLVHTIKGTCGFLGLPRLETLAHAAETLMGKYRDGAEVTPDGVSVILGTIDRIKSLLEELARTGSEPEGSDEDVIAQLDEFAGIGVEADKERTADQSPSRSSQVSSGEGTGAIQVLERELKPGEVSLDDLERAFQEAEGPEGIDLSAESAAAVAAEAASGRQRATDGNKTEKQAAEPETSAPETAAKERAGGSPADTPLKNQSIRVNVDTLEKLMTMVSELVLTRNQLLEMVRRHEDSEFKVPLQRLSNVTAELQEGVMKTRMQPIGNAWQKLPRIVRDLSRELSRKIDLEMIGAETELDRQVLEQIKDPLTHMVRNSADHSLESPEERIRLGKPEGGKITLRAYHEGGHILIEIADDGRGLDIDKIKAKIVEKGLANEAEIGKMGESQIQRFIFHPGFSTAEKVTSVSGRGVGMDVVRTNLELIGGTVDLKSVKGKGSTFIIKIPLTLAIVSALIVEACEQRFAIPQLSVVELVRAHKRGEHRIEMINQTPVLRLRDKLLPVVYLANLLHLTLAKSEVGEDRRRTQDKNDNVFVVVTQVGSQTFGIVVDGVFHTEEIVVKPMSNLLRDITMFSGNTILGDGSVIMIIDPNGMARAIQSEVDSESFREDKADDEAQQTGDDVTSLLVFRAGSQELKAVPLSLVTRLEEIDIASIEHANGRDLVQYRGTLMPLVYIDDHAGSKDSGQQPILVFTDNHRSMGLVVDDIVDIVDDRINIEIASERPGHIGSAVIKGKATEIIDVGHYLLKVFDDWMMQTDGQNTRWKQRLLLVDDSAFFRNMLAPLLTSVGYDVTLADSAEQALQLRDKGYSFDVIVSDIEMPEMDGFEFAQALRDNGEWKDIPLVALSSRSPGDTAERGRDSGFLGYVAKFDREGLIETLKDCRQRVGVAA